LVWDVSSGQRLNTYDWVATTRYGMNMVSWSSDGARIAVGGDQIIVWDVLSQSLLYRCGQNENGIYTVAWSPNGDYLASSSGDTALRLWDATTGKLLAQYSDPDGHIIQALSWSPDGRRIVTGNDNAAKWVLDLAAHNFLYSYPGTHPFNWTLSWSPNGKAIATGCDQSSVQIMNAPSA
jgi:WD40 repeat protein